jgi:hypothetical protein
MKFITEFGVGCGTMEKIRKREAVEIVECITSLCRAINNNRIIML